MMPVETASLYSLGCPRPITTYVVAGDDGHAFVRLIFGKDAARQCRRCRICKAANRDKASVSCHHTIAMAGVAGLVFGPMRRTRWQRPHVA